MNKAVFIDKDGTLIRNVPYNVDPEKIVLEPFAIDALKELKQQGFRLIIISNQAGIAHGYFAEAALEGVKERIQKLLAPDTDIDAFYFCPHHPEGKVTPYALVCNCRKPEPGMLIQAATELNIDLSASWMVGDILHDVEAGNKAGCQTILIDNGNETEWKSSAKRWPSYIVRNLKEASTIILQHSGNVNTSHAISQHH